MAKARGPITVRRVAQGSAAAGDARVGGSVDARLALVGVLSLSAWRTTGRPLPTYSRHEMPVRRTVLGARRDRD